MLVHGYSLTILMLCETEVKSKPLGLRRTYFKAPFTLRTLEHFRSFQTNNEEKSTRLQRTNTLFDPKLVEFRRKIGYPAKNVLPTESVFMIHVPRALATEPPTN